MLKSLSLQLRNTVVFPYSCTYTKHRPSAVPSPRPEKTVCEVESRASCLYCFHSGNCSFLHACWETSVISHARQLCVEVHIVRFCGHHLEVCFPQCTSPTLEEDRIRPGELFFSLRKYFANIGPPSKENTNLLIHLQYR